MGDVDGPVVAMKVYEELFTTGDNFWILIRSPMLGITPSDVFRREGFILADGQRMRILVYERHVVPGWRAA